MLPYPNPHHHFGGVSQEHPRPNPTTAGFPMLPPAAQHHLDQQHYVDHHFFPGAGHHFNSETLEAVLMRAPPARAAARAPECEAAAAVVVTAPPPQGGSGRRNGGVPAAAAAGGAQQQGHARARKRPFRTDRHSKIRTAQGVRDRRMRLSLDVARDFFALQDRLGFDKASKTVDWLLTQSKPAIERLAAAAGDAASSSPATTSAGAAAGGGSGGKRGGVADKLISGGSASMEMMENACELGRLVSAAPMLREYYCGLSGMMMSNDNDGGDDGDDDGEYEEDGDFLDGMQY